MLVKHRKHVAVCYLLFLHFWFISRSHTTRRGPTTTSKGSSNTSDEDELCEKTFSNQSFFLFFSRF